MVPLTLCLSGETLSLFLRSFCAGTPLLDLPPRFPFCVGTIV